MMRNWTKALPKLNGNTLCSNLLSKRYAGHSKWQNIRHIKGAKDAERSAIFTKLGRQMKVAVQEGGSIDPKLNLKLDQVIAQAKRVNMPTATVQSILKSCQADKSQAKSYIIEIKGPGSCFILCEVFTNHLHHLKMGMASILKKHQSKLMDSSCVHLFQEKGIIEADIPVEGGSTEEILEKATEDAIEAGAEDVSIVEDVLQFTCEKSCFNRAVQSLEKARYQIRSASVEYTPVKLQNLAESDLEVCQNLYKKLESLPEVVRISDNIA